MLQEKSARLLQPLNNAGRRPVIELDAFRHDMVYPFEFLATKRSRAVCVNCLTQLMRLVVDSHADIE